jgi:hypothetical protein
MNMKLVRKWALTPGCFTKIGMKWGKQNAPQKNEKECLLWQKASAMRCYNKINVMATYIHTYISICRTIDEYETCQEVSINTRMFNKDRNEMGQTKRPPKKWKGMLTLTKSFCHEEPSSSPWCNHASTSSALSDSWKINSGIWWVLNKDLYYGI